MDFRAKTGTNNCTLCIFQEPALLLNNPCTIEFLLRVDSKDLSRFASMMFEKRSPIFNLAIANILARSYSTRMDSLEP
jgi:hypothetical protein